MLCGALGKVRWAAERFRARFQPGALILLYHRIAEIAPDPQLLAVTPQHFAEHLKILKRRCVPMTLGDLTRAVGDGSVPRRAVAVTFDDGYADNLYQAKPLLDREQVPATVFVTTGVLGGDRETWWDELERIFLYPGSLPGTLRLTFQGKAVVFELAQDAHYADARWHAHRAWNVQWRVDPSGRHRIYRTLCGFLRVLDEEARKGFLEKLLEWSGVETKARPSHRMLTVDELLGLVDGGGIEAGAHTVTHPVLSSLAAINQQREIRDSKRSLEELLGRRVTRFAYPYGSRSDYTAETVRLVAGEGYESACGNFPGFVWRGNDCWQLPRVLIRDWDGESFERKLGAWFGG